MFIRARRLRLIWTEPVATNFGVDEILRRYGRIRKSPKQRQLSDMRHDIGKRALQELLIGDPT
jgi:hypothetical protein